MQSFSVGGAGQKPSRVTSNSAVDWYFANRSTFFTRERLYDQIKYMTATRKILLGAALAAGLTTGMAEAKAPTSAQVAKCLAKYGTVETSPASKTPSPYRFGLIGRTVSIDFKVANSLELWFYSTPGRAKEALSQAKVYAKVFHTTVGTNGAVLFTWNPRPTVSQAKALAACLR